MSSLRYLPNLPSALRAQRRLVSVPMLTWNWNALRADRKRPGSIDRDWPEVGDAARAMNALRADALI